MNSEIQTQDTLERIPVMLSNPRKSKEEEKLQMLSSPKKEGL